MSDDCGIPIAESFNIEISSINTTTEGSWMSYNCIDGFVPNNLLVAVCDSNGRWNPDPTEHICTPVTEMIDTKGSTIIIKYYYEDGLNC